MIFYYIGVLGGLLILAGSLNLHFHSYSRGFPWKMLREFRMLFLLCYQRGLGSGTAEKLFNSRLEEETLQDKFRYVAEDAKRAKEWKHKSIHGWLFFGVLSIVREIFRDYIILLDLGSYPSIPLDLWLKTNELLKNAQFFVLLVSWKDWLVGIPSAGGVVERMPGDSETNLSIGAEPWLLNIWKPYLSSGLDHELCHVVQIATQEGSTNHKINALHKAAHRIAAVELPAYLHGSPLIIFSFLLIVAWPIAIALASARLSNDTNWIQLTHWFGFL